MLEIPESHVIAGQLNETIRGKTISFVEAGHTPSFLYLVFRKTGAL